MKLGIQLSSGLIHEGSPRASSQSEPLGLFWLSISCRWSIYLVSFYLSAFWILAILIYREASLFLGLGLTSRGFLFSGCRSQIKGTPASRNSFLIWAWQRLGTGSSRRSCPGMTRLNACSKFLMQKSLVQVIFTIINNTIMIGAEHKNRFFIHEEDYRLLAGGFSIVIQLMKGFIVLCLLVLVTKIHSEVSLDNLKVFFESTYDQNKDGYATLQELITFFKAFEPDHDIVDEDIVPIFKFFDADMNLKISLKELIEVAKIKITVKPGHKQIHIGLTDIDGEMQVMWVSTPQKYNKPVVYYGHIPGQLKQKVFATFDAYNVGHVGFHGRIYRAVMKNLEPLKRYYYKVGDDETGTFSHIKYFKSPPLKVQQLEEVNIAVFGDMGTFAPFGHFVASQIAKDNFIRPFDFVFLTGDIAYAGMNAQKRGEIQPIWDLFGELTEKFTAYTPFMPGVGNHQKYYNYTSYMKRYHLPRNATNQTNLWFSFDYGQVHMVHFSSEHPYQLGSQQFDYLEEDLKKARNNPNIHWIILGVHRAFYSSNRDQYANITNLAFHLEDLVNKYKVDIVQTGHLHSYERSWPTYKGKAMKQRANLTHYMSPEHPVYVVQGNAGALIKQGFMKPVPEWSAKKFDRYGYGRIIIKGGHLKYQSITIPMGRVTDEWNIIKDVGAPIARQ